jgi:hypothetical protein
VDFTGAYVQQAKVTIVTPAKDGIFVAGWFSPVMTQLASGVGLMTAQSDHVVYNGTWVVVGYQETGVPARFTIENAGTPSGSADNVMRRDHLVDGTWMNAWIRPTSGSYPFSLASHRVTLGNRYHALGMYDDQALDVRWEWVYVRKYAAVEPTVIASGIEQEE